MCRIIPKIRCIILTKNKLSRQIKLNNINNFYKQQQLFSGLPGHVADQENGNFCKKQEKNQEIQENSTGPGSFYFETRKTRKMALQGPQLSL